ncbi:GDP-mannose 4,6-dehydratase [Maribacter aestuarii]|uniref:GDP-mannose 4,6-dehydratase n=1 Tax=Maribacter aestuarii TaxID=1130723 RepID=UPI0025A59E42|nr:GDP-mannose 4,6-dehydratase [Maribacter aestuarii]
MKVLVTGAAGFIGFHLVEALIKKGEDVIGIDNINSYYDVGLKYARLAESGIVPNSGDTQIAFSKDTLNYINSSKHKNYRFLRLDIIDLIPLEKLFVAEEFECVINLAAQAGVRHSIENPRAYIQSNVVGFLNILECSRLVKLSHLIYASSSSVYGDNSKIPFSENEKADMPVSLYAATKKSNELMAHAYSHIYGIRTTGLRFFTVYGPWGRPDMAPMLFADAITRGIPINVFNDGHMQRDFTYVDDTVEGILQLTFNSVPKSSLNANIYNIGNSKPIDLMDFIQGLEKEIGKKATKNFMPMQDGDVKVTFADTTKLNKVTGYKPKTDLKKGLSKFVGWYKSFYYG